MLLCGLFKFTPQSNYSNLVILKEEKCRVYSSVVAGLVLEVPRSHRGLVATPPLAFMPPTYLRQSRRYCLGYCSDIWEHYAAGNKIYRRYFAAGIHAKLNSSQLRRHDGGKDWGCVSLGQSENGFVISDHMDSSTPQKRKIRKRIILS